MQFTIKQHITKLTTSFKKPKPKCNPLPYRLSSFATCRFLSNCNGTIISSSIKFPLTAHPSSILLLTLAYVIFTFPILTSHSTSHRSNFSIHSARWFMHYYAVQNLPIFMANIVQFVKVCSNAHSSVCYVKNNTAIELLKFNVDAERLSMWNYFVHRHTLNIHVR